MIQTKIVSQHEHQTVLNFDARPSEGEASAHCTQTNEKPKIQNSAISSPGEKSRWEGFKRVIGSARSLEIKCWLGCAGSHPD